MTQYDCRNSTNTVATFRLKLGDKDGKYRQVLAYSTFDEEYLKMIEEGLAEGRLDVFCSKNRHIRTLTMSSPVMQVISYRQHVQPRDKIYFLLQVISCRQHVYPRDKIYFLLWDAGIWSVTGSLMEDVNVPNDELDLELIAIVCDETKTLTTPNPSIDSISGLENLLDNQKSFTDDTRKDVDQNIDDDDGEYKGFCVYNDRIAVFGYNGLCIKDISDSDRAAESIKVLHKSSSATVGCFSAIKSLLLCCND